MSSIHKDLDRRMKAFPEEEPRIFLHMIGALDLNADATVEVLSNETSPPVKIPDYVARIEIRDREPFLLHAEFEAVWSSRVVREVARRGASLAWQYEMPVHSVVMIVQPDGCPASVPRLGKYVVGETCVTHPFETLRMWEMDPRMLLDSGDYRRSVWAVLMRSTFADALALGGVVARNGDEDLITRFLAFAAVRYHEDELQVLEGVCRMGLMEAIEEASWYAQKLVNKGVQRGRTEGLAEGLAEGVESCQAIAPAGLAVTTPGPGGHARD